jgi:hypothetical protein
MKPIVCAILLIASSLVSCRKMIIRDHEDKRPMPLEKVPPEVILRATEFGKAHHLNVLFYEEQSAVYYSLYFVSNKENETCPPETELEAISNNDIPPLRGEAVKEVFPGSYPRFSNCIAIYFRYEYKDKDAIFHTPY